MNRLFLLLTVVLALGTRAFGYGHEGHQAIAEIARTHLSPSAHAAVIQILGTDDLASIATWLDDVRAAGRNRGSMKGDGEAKDFNKRFPKSSSWHFVNFPVGSSRYDPASVFATENDVIHAVSLAIKTLEGASTGLSRAEALKVLVHCVGDLHQPLHCITGYYDISNPTTPRLLTSDEATLDSAEDAGGNALFFTKSENLHELFDTILLKRIVKGTDYHQLAAEVERQNKAGIQTSPGDYHQWHKQWASETVKLGTDAYRGLIFGTATTSPGRGRSVRLHRINITLPPGYESTEADVLASQIARAGLRLAELLNSIRWAQN